MTATEVLSALSAAGLTATLSGFADPALLVSPRSALTPELRTIVAAHRDGIVDLLYGARADAEWPWQDAWGQQSRDAMARLDDGVLISTAHSQELSL